MMRRREFMRAFLAATVTPSIVAQTVVPPQTRQGPPAPGPVPWMQGLDHAKLETVTTLNAEQIAETDAVFFSTKQMATLSRLCDVMMPPMRGYPGALQAEAPEFLDFFVSESSGEIQRFYQGGLNWLDAEAQHRLKLPFAKLSAAQADEVIRPLLRTWMTDHYPDDVHEKFINAAHADIRLATMNSQAWADRAGDGEQATRKDMYWSPVEPDLQRKTTDVTARATRTIH